MSHPSVASKYDGTCTVMRFFDCIAGRHECNQEAQNMFQKLQTDEERIQAVSDMLMGVLMCAQKALEMKCPCANNKCSN